MKWIFTLLLLLAPLFPLHAVEYKGWTISGHLNTWSLYETDDISSTTVAVVYDTSTTPPTAIGVAVGPDIPAACSAANRQCEYRKIGEAGHEDELRLGRTTNSGTEDKGTIGGDTLISNLGVDSKFSKNEWSGRINGNFTSSLLDNRALYGSQKYRPRFSDTYAQYQKDKVRIAAGRKSILAGLTVDGLTADYLFGPESSRDSKTLGVFVGFAPDPISKYPTADYITFGPTFKFIPNFSAQTETKLVIENSLVTELYQGEINRFYLFSKAHFTPVRTFSVLGLSTLDLPGVGNTDSGFKSNYASLQTFWRPNPEWFSSFGFSQFRIDRFMEPQAVRWVTDNGSAQSLRVSDSLDHSHRYRFDMRLSYRPIHVLQPFIRLRYERRTIDSNKLFGNAPPTATTPSRDLNLFARKDAYRATGGFRFFLFDDRLESESAATLNQRFQSKGYDFFQSLTWDSGTNWTLDSFFQWVASERKVDNSVTLSSGSIFKATDYYTGLGGSYRFLSNFLAQIRYDFSNEEDYALARTTSFHTILARLDYSF